MKTGEIWQADDMIILLGTRMPNDIWMVAPFGGGVSNLKRVISHIRSGGIQWAYNEISGDDIRKNFHKVYEAEI